MSLIRDPSYMPLQRYTVQPKKHTADIFLWRDKKITASVLGFATSIWVLFELLQYHLFTLVCHILILALAVLFLWFNASTFIYKSPPQIPDVILPEDIVLGVAAALRTEINKALENNFCCCCSQDSADIFLWRDKKITASVLGFAISLWVLFELLQYHLLTLVCHILILALAVLCLWSNASTFINKFPSQIPDVILSEDIVLCVAAALGTEITKLLKFFGILPLGMS